MPPPGDAAAMSDPVATADRFLDALAQAFAPDARVRALLPEGPTEIVGADAIAARFERWFGPPEPMEVEARSVEPLSGSAAVGYRFRFRLPDGAEEVVEQRGYLSSKDGLVAAMDLVCSGFRFDRAGPAGSLHTFDAGDLGCGSGLPAEFRRRIGAIPVGDALAVIARDPSAKEDLPALARLLGHEVKGTEVHGDGRIEITFVRGK